MVQRNSEANEGVEKNLDCSSRKLRRISDQKQIRGESEEKNITSKLKAEGSRIRKGAGAQRKML
jgi:hypothetical protein